MNDEKHPAEEQGRRPTEPRTDVHDLHDVIDGPDYSIIEDEAERLLERVRAEGRAEAAQGAAPLDEYDSMADYEEHMAALGDPDLEGAAPRAEGLDGERLRRELTIDHTKLLRGHPDPSCSACQLLGLSRPSDEEETQRVQERPVCKRFRHDEHCIDEPHA